MKDTLLFPCTAVVVVSVVLRKMLLFDERLLGDFIPSVLTLKSLFFCTTKSTSASLSRNLKPVGT